MTRQYVFILFLGFFSFSQASQIPEAYVPGKSVRYPENYCENIKNHEEFDFVIIGSGPGGSTVARRLAENPTFNVLLMEAGGDPPKFSDLPGKRLEIIAGTTGTDLRWKWQSKPNTFGCASNRTTSCQYDFAKVLGGSSVINMMLALRGNPKDFDEWEQLGNKGWAYKDVLPYFKKLEDYNGPPDRNLTVLQTIQRLQDILNGVETENIDNIYHGKHGPLPVSQFPTDPLSHPLRQALFKAFKTHKLPLNEDPNGKTQTGFTNIPGMIDSLGYRASIVKAYLQNVPKNLKVCKNAMVWNLNVKDSRSQNKTIESVLFEYNNKFYNVTAKKEYILSAGGIGSPQIMERSGIGNPKILKKAGVTVKHELPGVGENLQDHFTNFASTFIISLNNEASENPFSVGITSLMGYLNLTDYSDFVPDVQFTLVLPELPGPSHPEFDTRIKVIKVLNMRPLLFFAYVLRQQIPGSVHITQSTNPNLSPLIEPNYYKGKRDLELTIAAAKLIRKIMRHPALTTFMPILVIEDQCKQFPEDSDQQFICQLNYTSKAAYHSVGTSSMGPDPKKHVVNQELKVHGMQNLRIIDSSIMPFIVRSTTELSTIMIAEKGADMIKVRWNSG